MKKDDEGFKITIDNVPDDNPTMMEINRKFTIYMNDMDKWYWRMLPNKLYLKIRRLINEKEN
jgi:hypothetical protein